MRIKREFTIVAVHGELEQPEGVEKPDCTVVARTAEGETLELRPATWPEAAEFRERTSIILQS